MALIKCKECGHEVSDKASACPNCGSPIESFSTTQVEAMDEEPKKKKAWIWALVVALLCLTAGGGYFAYYKLFKGKRDKEAVAAIVELTPEFARSLEVYDELGPFSEGFAAVKRGKKWGYINTKGEEVIPCSFDYAEVFSEGLAAVCQNNKYGFIDTTGKTILPFTFENMPKPFSEGLAAVCIGNKWGWIDKNGETAIPFTIKAEEVGNFSEGLAFVYREGFGDDSKFSFIDKNGKDVFSGTMGGDFYHSGYRGSLEPNDFPSFHDGVVYVSTTDSSVGDFVKYDKQGKKLQTITLDKLPNLQKYQSEDYSLYGVKEGNKILVPAKYDLIGGEFGNLVQSSNGVVLVGLYEYGDDEEETIVHYGYADLKGNDTFTDEIRELCRKSKELLSQYNEEDSIFQTDESSSYNSDWLQGRWVGTDSKSGYSIEMIINGENLIQKIGGQVCYNGSYQYDGNMLIYNNANDFWPVDKDNKVLTLDGVPMRKEDGGYSTSSSSGSYSNSSYNNSSSSSNELAKYDEKISQYYPIMEEAYQQFMRDVRSGGYTTITPPNSFYELSKACSSVGAAANEARKICIKKGDIAGEQKYERIWEREKRLYDSAYQILGNLH